MKNIILLLAFASIAGVASAQKLADKNVPQVVKNAFSKLYPNVTIVKWEKENGNYEAGFVSNKKEQSVLLDPKGNVKETEEEIALNQLPKGVVEHVKAHYPGKPIKGASKIIDGAGLIKYEVEIKGMDLIFDAGGKFIKEEKEEGKKGDKD